jgi:hypothetical protein
MWHKLYVGSLLVIAVSFNIVMYIRVPSVKMYIYNIVVHMFDIVLLWMGILCLKHCLANIYFLLIKHAFTRFDFFRQTYFEIGYITSYSNITLYILKYKLCLTEKIE